MTATGVSAKASKGSRPRLPQEPPSHPSDEITGFLSKEKWRMESDALAERPILGHMVGNSLYARCQSYSSDQIRN